MMHLPIHLAREHIIVGPYQFCWIYPFERYGYYFNYSKYVSFIWLHYLHCSFDAVLKGYNESECLIFCSLYLDNVKTIFTKPDTNYDGDGQIASSISPFSYKDHGVGAPIFDELSMIKWAKIIWYVLNNCVEVLPYIK